MRYLASLICVLAALPLSVSAKDGEEGETLEPNVKESVSSPAPKSEVPDIDTLSQRAIEHYEIKTEQYGVQGTMMLRVQRAKIGFGVSGGVFGAGFVLMMAAAGGTASTFLGPSSDWVDPVLFAGVAISSAGIVGMVTAGGILAHRRRKLRRLQEAHYTTPRRVQWDLARSRLVF